MRYHVLLVPSGKLSSTTTANIWFRIAGSVAQTPTLNVPKSTVLFTFEHRNLGVLSTLRIGHDNAGLSPNWYLDYVIVRNEITGHTCKFACGRWLGRAVDDGSIERLLVAEQLPLQVETQDVRSCPTPPRTRSPSARRLLENPRVRISEIQQWLGEAVNNVVKYFYKPDRQKSNLTQLLCGERGLVRGLEQAFLVGFKSSRLFKQRWAWDYISKQSEWFDDLLHDDPEQLSREQSQVVQHFCRLVATIDANTTLGKDDKFQTFILIALRDRMLTGILPLMAKKCPITVTMYEEMSFLRHPHYLTFLTQLLASMKEFDFELEQSLTWGIDA